MDIFEMYSGGTSKFSEAPEEKKESETVTDEEATDKEVTDEEVGLDDSMEALDEISSSGADDLDSDDSDTEETASEYVSDTEGMTSEEIVNYNLNIKAAKALIKLYKYYKELIINIQDRVIPQDLELIKAQVDILINTNSMLYRYIIDGMDNDNYIIKVLRYDEWHKLFRRITASMSKLMVKHKILEEK